MDVPMNPSRQLASARPYRSSEEGEAIGLLLANCLQLVVPASMTADDRAAWILSAVDALEDIRASEVEAVSAEVRRSVTRAAQIVPEIARLVAERRTATQKEREARARLDASPPLPELPQRTYSEPLSPEEIERMPKWLKDMGLRVGFLKREGGKLVNAA